MYYFTRHARQRIIDRKLEAEWVWAAFRGLRRQQADGTVLHCDPVSRCALVIAPNGAVMTAFTMNEDKFNQFFQEEICPQNGAKLPNTSST